MTRIFVKLALGSSLALLACPADVLAGRGGGRGGGGGGGGYGGGGYGGQSRGGGTGGNPSFSQPRPSTNESRPPGSTGYGNSSSGNRSAYGNSSESGNRSNTGAAAAGAGYSNRNQSPSNAGAAAVGAGAANRNQQPAHSNAAAGAAGAGAANRNQQPNVSNAGAAAAGAGAANRNQPNYSNAGAAAAGAGAANRNQPNYSNAGAAAAGAGVANRNQPNYPNAGAAAAGAGYANRNQPNMSNAGAAAVGAGYANRNQPNMSNAGAAAVGAGYANRNQYNQYHPGMVNGYWNGNNSAAWGAAGVGLAAGAGVGAWGAGSPMYSYGYSGYNNPYAGVPAGAGGGVPQAGNAAQPAGVGAYNYAQPINTSAAPPEQSVTDQATAAFDQSREAFKAGDYPNALQLVQQALTQMPNDTTLHEFLGLVLFAQGQYEQAAAPLYAVLTVGPGWDWTTLSGMYPDVATYTGQLRNLEAYIDANPRSAQARFVLAYQYLSQGHDDNAVAQLKQVVKLQPGDTLSAQLIARSQPAGDTPPPASVAVPTAAPVDAGKLTGRWAATPAKDASVALAIQDDGRFTWAMTSQGKPAMSIAGASTFADGVLSLVDQDGKNGTLAGNVTWKDADHFNFRVAGSPPSDPGLNFAR
jgi:Tetratricopeptide repeat